MGVLGRLEKKIEGMVNGVFARAFKGDVQPVEIAARLQRELDGEAKLLSRDRRLVPNDFTVSLSSHDHDRLAPYGSTLTAELVPQLRNHAATMGYVFNGPVVVHFEHDPDLPTGRFTVASAAVAGAITTPPAERRQPPRPPADLAQTQTDATPVPVDATSPPTRQPKLVLEVNGVRHPLEPPGFIIGRGSEADLRISDPGISRRHAELRVRGSGADQQITIVDLGSTNGVVVNGRRVKEAALGNGSRVEIGSTRMLVHDPRESVPRESVPRGSVPRESVPRGSVPRGSVPRESGPPAPGGR